MAKKSKYIDAVQKLGGQATIQEVRRLLIKEGHFAPSHNVGHSLMRLAERGRLVSMGNTIYKISEGFS